MKKSLVALLLLACFPLVNAQKLRYGQEPPKAKPGIDYPVKVHISGIRIRRYYDYYTRTYDKVLHADAVIDQKKLELTGDNLYDPKYVKVIPVPGDYTARLLKTAHKGAAVPLDDEYEILLPDRTIWRGTITGIFE
ncbi:MAG TPA: hypothetical protein VJX73_14975 [Terracidiphilus sp.]|nr:hypothetical protein [Terracidiphilus sp.]